MFLGWGIIVPAMAQSNAPGASQPARPERGLLGNDDPSVQLNQLQQAFDRQKLKEEISEEKAKTSLPAAQRDARPSSVPAIRFTLNAVQFNSSQILSPSELEAVTQRYVHREIGVEDLYKIVDEINAIYDAKGYSNARAILTPQTIKQGVVHIDLVEGKTGKVSIEGNDSTRESFIRNRLSLEYGKVANFGDLQGDLVRFNALNDAQLGLVLKAGEQEGTTDYLIQVQEPPRWTVRFFSDNAGSENNGEYRYGMSVSNASLFGRRDALTVTGLASEGTRSGAISYAIPLTPSGLKLALAYSANTVEIVSGPLKPLKVEGEGQAFSASLTHPVFTSERIRSQVGLEYTYQQSQTDFLSSIPWVDDKTEGIQIFYDRLLYGERSAFYQKYLYRHGSSKDKINKISKDYDKFQVNYLYQQGFSNNAVFSLRLDSQFATTDYLPSSEWFYIGGMYSVRGYTESLLGADNGVNVSVEQSVPLFSSSVSAVAFTDYGQIWGKNAYQSKSLWSAGVGVKGSLGKHLSFSTGVGFPLQKTINDTKVDNARFYFTVNAQF